MSCSLALCFTSWVRVPHYIQMVVSKFDPSVLASGKTRVTGMCVYASIVCTFLTHCLFFIFSLKKKRKETRKKCWRAEGLGSGERVEEKKQIKQHLERLFPPCFVNHLRFVCGHGEKNCSELYRLWSRLQTQKCCFYLFHSNNISSKKKPLTHYYANN